ncbi:MAG TPA: glycosyltransferase family 2 protein [Candidatus Saccharimonadales bacterium]|nr:glycosyltransferase family 2 protein [Candidatus Saccharimonadales bacterium]
MKHKSLPRFSVVIPAYNEAPYIAETLLSLKRQNFAGRFEIIVVDNNSSDATAEIARSLGANVVEEKNPGVCNARQRGTEVAQGEIVISTDADTQFRVDWLSRIDGTFSIHKDAVAVVGSCHYSDGPIWGLIYPYLLFGLISTIYRVTGRTYYATATNIAFKKSAWHGYNTTLTQGGDELDLLRNLRKQGRVVFANGNPTLTSARRLARGFIYNFFVSFLIYYVLEYNLNRIFKRRILGSAPHFRNDFSPKILSLFNAAIIGFLLTLVITQHNARHYVVHETTRVIKDTSRAIDKDKKKP